MIQCLINVIMQTYIPVTILYPGWNTHVDQLYDAAKQSFKAWLDADKPKHGFVFDEMKRSRASFKYGLRFFKAAYTPRNWQFISCTITSW